MGTSIYFHIAKVEDVVITPYNLSNQHRSMTISQSGNDLTIFVTSPEEAAALKVRLNEALNKLI
jgi:hypothetical protein